MENDKYIPLCEPELNGNESIYLKECIDSTWVSSSGTFLDRFEEKITEYTGSKHAIACVSGTSAIHASLKLSGVRGGDEVLIPTLTFIAPINAVLYCNASPVFFDCDQFHNIDTKQLEKFLKEETYFQGSNTYNKATNKIIRAIVVVHVWGNCAHLDKILELGKEYNIEVIEDASESLGSFYEGAKSVIHSGTAGLLGCLSFNGNKIITTGGGGAILTNDDILAKKARYILSQAKDDPIEYIHNEVGYNYRLTNLQASLGLAQIEQLQEKVIKKKKINTFYKNNIDTNKGRSILAGPSNSRSNQWLNVLKLDPDKHKDWRCLFQHLKRNNIDSRPVWFLNHNQKPFKEFQKYSVTRAESEVRYSLCLPSSVGLIEEDLYKICNLINSYE